MKRVILTSALISSFAACSSVEDGEGAAGSSPNTRGSSEVLETYEVDVQVSDFATTSKVAVNLTASFMDNSIDGVWRRTYVEFDEGQKITANGVVLQYRESTSKGYYSDFIEIEPGQTTMDIEFTDANGETHLTQVPMQQPITITNFVDGDVLPDLQAGFELNYEPAEVNVMANFSVWENGKCPNHFDHEISAPGVVNFDWNSLEEGEEANLNSDYIVVLRTEQKSESGPIAPFTEGTTLSVAHVDVELAIE